MAAANRGASYLLLAGVVLFSGSLYLLALTNIRWLGAITPLGGLCFLAGWAWLILGAASLIAAARAERACPRPLTRLILSSRRHVRCFPRDAEAARDRAGFCRDVSVGADRWAVF